MTCRAGRKIARARQTSGGAQLCRAHPGRFGLVRIVAARRCRGLAHRDRLCVSTCCTPDGIGLATHYDGVGLGDPKFEPVFAEFEPAQGRRLRASGQRAVRDRLDVDVRIGFDLGAVDRVSDQYGAHDLEHVDGRTHAAFCRICASSFVTAAAFCRSCSDDSRVFAGWNTVGPERLATIFPDGVYAEFAKLYFEMRAGLRHRRRSRCCARFCRPHICSSAPFSATFRSRTASSCSANLDLPADVRALIAGENAAARCCRLGAPKRRRLYPIGALRGRTRLREENDEQKRRLSVRWPAAFMLAATGARAMTPPETRGNRFRSRGRIASSSICCRPNRFLRRPMSRGARVRAWSHSAAPLPISPHITNHHLVVPRVRSYDRARAHACGGDD